MAKKSREEYYDRQMVILRDGKWRGTRVDVYKFEKAMKELEKATAWVEESIHD